jgi:hypothetical protein
MNIPGKLVIKDLLNMEKLLLLKRILKVWLLNNQMKYKSAEINESLHFYGDESTGGYLNKSVGLLSTPNL